MQVVEEGITKAIVWVIQIPRLGPKRHRNAGELEPVNQRPQYPILEVQKQNDRIWLDALGSRLGIRKTGTVAR